MNAPPYLDYPLKNIPSPHPHDVLCGRGGGTNNHIGNNHWRALVAANKQLYVTLPKRQKMLLSRSIVNAVRSQNPPGRFLQKDSQSDKWYDVGDQKATEKTSQALREGAPIIRKSTLKEEESGEAITASSTADSTRPSTTKQNSSGNLKQAPATNMFSPAQRATLVPPYPPNGGAPAAVPSAAGIPPPPPPPPVSSPGMMLSPSQMMAIGMFNSGIMSPGMMQFNQGMGPPLPPPVPAQSPNDVPKQRKKKQMKEETPQDQPQQQQQQQNPMANNNPNMPPPPPPGARFDFENMCSIVQPLEPTGISFGSISMTSAEHNRLQPTGTSFGSVSMGSRVLPVDGGLEPAGLSYGSQFSMNSVEQSYLNDALYEPDPIREKPNGVPSYQIATKLEQRKSKGNLLECSDTESEDDECSNDEKAEDWKKMQEQLQSIKAKEQARPAPKITIPPPLEEEGSTAQPDLDRDVSAMSTMSFMSLDPISTNRNVSLAVAQLAGCNPTDLKQDVSIAFSEMSLSRDVSSSDPLPAFEDQKQSSSSENVDDVVPPLPLMQTTTKEGELSEEEKLQMMYLTRGGSLVFDNFGKNKR